MNNLYLVSNDKVWFSKKKYTSNNDLENIISSLNKKFKIQLICRKSSVQKKFLLKSKFDYCELNEIYEKKINLFLISITPFNFFVFLYLNYFKKIKINGFVYLRSDGFMEYKYRLGVLGYYLYFVMFWIISKKLKIISCSKNFTKVKVNKIVHPSELSKKWLMKNRSNKFSYDFLYVGRFKKEKGVMYLAEQFKNFLDDYTLKIIGTDKKFIPKKFHCKNINYIGSISNVNKLVNFYDKSRIFILPSYIEGFPKVISESLARLRPVIIFEDIKYVIHGRKGIFVCKRNEKSLRKTINYILKNYSKIQIQIKKNFFFTKKNFMEELVNSIKL